MALCGPDKHWAPSHGGCYYYSESYMFIFNYTSGKEWLC